MINYTIKNRSVEITYNTGAELRYINHILGLIDSLNELKKVEKK